MAPSPLDQIDMNKTNIYILAGVFGGSTLILIVLVIILFANINNFKSRIAKLQQDVNVAMSGPAPTIFPRAAPSKVGSIYGGPQGYNY